MCIYVPEAPLLHAKSFSRMPSMAEIFKEEEPDIETKNANSNSEVS